jgi:pimeloyl-ACP methyl ester carboxylesterase
MEQTTQKLIPVRGGHLTVDIHGEPDGPAVVVIPGVMADAAAWAPVATALSAWPTVVVVNRRGRQGSAPLTSEYSVDLEVEDAVTVLRNLADVRTLFGWSFGALIALHAADDVTVPHLIGYEPIMAPFGFGALPGLRRADADGDHDASVEVALRDVTGMPPEVIADLRAETPVWDELRRLSTPIYAETRAINENPRPAARASRAQRVDLIVGERNQGQAPYGTAFTDVARSLPSATIHVLAGQGHLAHLEAPTELAALVDKIGYDKQ